MTAADERRHGVAHMSEFLSVRDLIEQVSKDLPADTTIPSESTVLFAFVPNNSHKSSAKFYKSKVNLKFKVQTIQLRNSHVDEHYALAQFKYMREFAVKFRDRCTFLSVDDKSKIDYGEPQLAMSSGVRGKKAIAPANTILGALDHDVNSKGSLTPSVCLDVDIPETLDSFYRGKVTVILKDAVFQPSNPFRHAIELLQNVLNNDVKPMLIMYSDGGPDHMLKWGRVKLSLIALFLRLNIDMLIAGRTAPNHSWANIVERIMSILNIAYQNCALSRVECSSEKEQLLRSCGGMTAIREKALNNPEIRQAWLQSVTPMIDLLNERHERMALKGESIKSGRAATDDDVESLKTYVITKIDPEIEKGKYLAKDLCKKESYQAWIKSEYSFQIKTCEDSLCCEPKKSDTNLEWVPEPMFTDGKKEHYQPFDKAYGTETTERDCPSLSVESSVDVAEREQSCKNKELIAQRVRTVVKCLSCKKLLCVYAKDKLSTIQTRLLKKTLENYDYSCGSPITSEEDKLHPKVFVRLQSACNSPIEWAYYASTIAKQDTCCHCGCKGAKRDEELMKKYKIVLPSCDRCSHKKPMKRNPIKN